jgi:hypothetical protein
MKEYKLLMKLCRICKDSDHNTNQCPSKAMSENCPLKEIVLMLVVQIEIPILQKPK